MKRNKKEVSFWLSLPFHIREVALFIGVGHCELNIGFPTRWASTSPLSYIHSNPLFTFILFYIYLIHCLTMYPW